ncbi:MAG: hemin uptake protein HemP [Methyloceanibacter sp.]
MLESTDLFGSHKQVVIGHNGRRYVLRITRYGKLILNK